MGRHRPSARKPEDLASEPGKLTLALAITRAHNGVDVNRGPLVVCSPAEPRAIRIETTPRIGATSADRPLRFLTQGRKRPVIKPRRFRNAARATRLC
jgi:DNA-3-methyladenine glycosylase